MTYKIQLTTQASRFLESVSNKTKRIIKENLKKLEDSPYPGRSIGDKERLPVQGKDRYRIHIGRTWTAFYLILEQQKKVRVEEILHIDDAHKRYGF